MLAPTKQAALIAVLLLLGSASAAVKDRSGVLIGYSEKVPSDRGRQEWPEVCGSGAERGECLACLTGPSMKQGCAATCKLVQRCIMSEAAAASWAGHATSAGTAKFAAGVKAAPGHFKKHGVRYSGAPQSLNVLICVAGCTACTPQNGRCLCAELSRYERLLVSPLAPVLIAHPTMHHPA